MKFAALIEEGRRAWPDVEVSGVAVSRQLVRARSSESSLEHAGDRFLAAACCAGSRSAIEAFVGGPLRRALARVRRDLRADVGQTVAARLLGGESPALLQYAGTATLERWLRRTVENAARDFARSNKQHEGLDRWLTGILSSPERRVVDALSRAPVKKIVRDVLAGLEAEERTLLRLFHRDGVPHAEIGERLGLPRSTVAHRLMRLHQKLQRLIRERVRGELELATGELEDALSVLRAEWSGPLDF